MNPSAEPRSPLIWDEPGAPRSRFYGDIYYSGDDGLAESRAVFLAGCDLPAAWMRGGEFVVAELGFGTGLNVAALLDLWRATAPADGRLRVFSLDAHPITVDDGRRALGRWAEIADVTAALTAAWPGCARGFHRIELPRFRATVDVAVMDVGEALRTWSGQADAWFLDGFSPALNPAMWGCDILSLVAARSSPGARAASFTVAGEVRRNLASAGFTIDRRPGFGRKRHRLEARLPGHPSPSRPPRRIAIIGGGIAGASLVRAFTAAGARCDAFDAKGPGAGASGGPAALVTPRLDAGLGDNAALFAHAFRRAGQLYEATPGAVIARGALQKRMGPKDAARFDAIASSDLFEPGLMRLSEDGLRIEGALVVDPRAILKAWMPSPQVQRVAGLAPGADGWSLLGTDGGSVGPFDIVILACGMDCARLTADLPLHPVRGQASLALGVQWPVATLFGSYVIPTRDGVLFGATHDRDDTDIRPRETDHLRNVAAVAQALPTVAAAFGARRLEAWTGIRATTRDYLPLAGPAPEAPGLFVLSGLGSRGFTLAPLLAEHLAALILSAPSPLPRPLADLVDPARFARRASRRGRPSAHVSERTP